MLMHALVVILTGEKQRNEVKQYNDLQGYLPIDV